MEFGGYFSPVPNSFIQFVSSTIIVLVLPRLSSFLPRPSSPHLSSVTVCFRVAPSMNLIPRITAEDTCWISPRSQRLRPWWARIPWAVAPLRLQTGSSAPQLPPLHKTFHNTTLCQQSRMHLCRDSVWTGMAHYGTCKHVRQPVTNSKCLKFCFSNASRPPAT